MNKYYVSFLSALIAFGCNMEIVESSNKWIICRPVPTNITCVKENGSTVYTITDYVQDVINDYIDDPNYYIESIDSNLWMGLISIGLSNLEIGVRSKVEERFGIEQFIIPGFIVQ
ncbi:uncharacterized protein LOC135930934 [Gordionus sp. m RMFG-2023]|uniref:uncharacterized protein LOC135930934 n=1 Tax=Gordionus sp. m RMFG-2023 TaxID=3053472 RepID=UPI0031FCE84D